MKKRWISIVLAIVLMFEIGAASAAAQETGGTADAVSETTADAAEDTFDDSGAGDAAEESADAADVVSAESEAETLNSSEAQDENADTESDEAVYPEDWIEEDPLNGRAYEQIYGDDEISDTSARLYSSASGTAITTSWDGVTYTHNDYNVSDVSDIKMGIDVSYHQSNIDWEKVADAGVTFAIIRVGFRGYGSSGSVNLDTKFYEYIKGAMAAGIEVGVYFYSQAITEAEAVEEAEFVLEKLDGYDLDLPVAFDMEYASNSSGSTVGRLYNANLSKAKKTAIVMAFCSTIEDGGYTPMLYASSNWLYSELNTSTIAAEYSLWMARYSTYSYDSSKDASNDLYSGQIQCWQCSSKASVDGISTNVDLDWWYYEEEEENLVYDSETEQWRYVDEDGEYDDTYTGFAKSSEGWYYLKNGSISTGTTSVIKGTVKGETAWWYVCEGKVDFTYDGFATNSNGKWYIESGKVTFSKNSVIKDKTGAIGTKGTWWYVVGSKVQTDF
ncbi:MAG: glycoside hydrolase family 25 protein, partial [Clostridiales bacterium]|nr:glycoside hydrolase family 25 protein [Clostridiales bacterium]